MTLLTRKEAREFLRIGRTKFYELERAGKIVPCTPDYLPARFSKDQLLSYEN